MNRNVFPKSPDNEATQNPYDILFITESPGVATFQNQILRDCIEKRTLENYLTDYSTPQKYDSYTLMSQLNPTHTFKTTVPEQAIANGKTVCEIFANYTPDMLFQAPPLVEKIVVDTVQPTPEDARLMREFSAIVPRLDLAEIVVSQAKQLVVHLDKFALAPITGLDPANMTKSSAATFVDVEPHISMTYKGTSCGKPWLDAHQAIGLTYEDHLIAVGAAYVTDASELFINQIQDVSGLRKVTDGRKYFKSGLHNKMLWQDTLVNAWEVIAAEIGVQRCIIQSTQNNSWHAVRNGAGRPYDDVANRMGYTMDPATNNWYRNLDAAPAA